MHPPPSATPGRIWPALALALLLSLPLAGDEVPADLAFLGDASYPPMTYLENGDPKGVVIDILHALERRTGRRISIRLMPWKDAQEAVLRGEGDALCQMSITDARRQTYDFTDQMLESQYSIFARADRSGLVGMDDLHGLQVGVTSGGLPRQLVKDDPSIRMVVIEDYDQGFAMLRAGSIDAVLADRWVGAYILAEHRIGDIRISPEPVATRASAIAVRKGNAALLAVLSDGVRSLYADGTIARIASEWQPKEVVFMTRERIERWVYGIALGILGLVLTAMAAWALHLRREVAVRRRTEAALSASEARFRAVFEQAPIGIAVIDVASSRLVQVNPAFCAIVGRDSADLLAGDIDRLTHPDDRAATTAGARALGAGEIGRFVVQKRYLRPDGGTVWAEMAAVAEREPGRPTRHAVALVRDITERRQAEEERRLAAEQIAALHERLALATRAARIGIWDWDVPANVLVWDEEMYRIYQISPTDFSGAVEAWAHALHPDDRQRAQSEVQAALTGGGGFETEFRIRWPDGSVRSIGALGQVIRGGDGRPLRMVGINFDVTERRQAEDALRRHREDLEILVTARTSDLEQARKAAVQLGEAAAAANRAKSDFLASMSHEIRTPLNAVLGYAQLLARDQSLAPGHRRAIEVINRSGEHLLSLISDILEMSRIEAGRSAVDPEDFDLHDLLTNLKSLFLLRSRDKGLELRLALAPELPRFIRTDQRKLRQILVNLVSNAVKFTPSGWVEVAASHADGRLRIEIRDSGQGIADADQARLFNPFVQVGSGRGNGEGSGLGLAISRGFARILGGDLTLASDPGCGSTFALDIPVAVVEQAGRIAISRREAIGLAPGSRPPRILIAEDHHDSQRLLLDLLSSLGLEARAVGDGAAAVAVCREWHPDLVWMDIDMPVMDGLAATSAIRQLPGKPPVIIALTAAAFEEDRARILAGGCNEVMRKPYREEDLLVLMEGRLGIRFLWKMAATPAAGDGDEADDLASDRDLAAAVARLPAEDHRRLHQAVVTGDLNEIAALAAGWHDRLLAERIIALAQAFAMDRLARLCPPGEGDGI